MVTPALKANYAGVFDGRIGFGERPAIVVVDFVNAYTAPDSPLFAEDVVAAVANTAPLLALAREHGVPVVFTRVLYNDNGTDGGVFVHKVPVLRRFVAGEPLTQIDAALTPQAEDLVIVKQYASAFFGTCLASTLVARGVDTLIVTGCSTSGCVRATAVDGMQYGFRVIVPRECVGDRAAEPHEANLFDIDSKYGDVVGVDQVVDYVRSRDAKVGAV